MTLNMVKLTLNIDHSEIQTQFTTTRTGRLLVVVLSSTKDISSGSSTKGSENQFKVVCSFFFAFLSIIKDL